MSSSNSIAIKEHTVQYSRRWWTLVIVSMTVFMATIDETILNVALPSLQNDLGAPASALQWIINSYVLVFGGLLLTMGGLGDRFGRARMLRLGLGLFGLSSLLAALAQSPGQLIAARAFMGMGGAMMMPSTLSIIVNVFSGAERAKAIAVWSMMAGVGVALGPVLGGALLQQFYWGSVFLVNLPVAGLTILASLYLVPESKDPDSRPLDVPGAALSAGAVAALIYAIIEAPERGLASGAVILAATLFVVLTIGFVVRERLVTYPLLDFSLFRIPRFSIGAATVIVAFFAMVGFIFGLTQYLQFVQGYSPLAAGIRFLPVAFGFMVGAIAGEQLVRTLGTKIVVMMGLTITAAVMPIALLWEVDSAYWIVGSVIGFTGLGMGLVIAPAAEAVMGAVELAKAGVGSAMNDVTQMLSSALSIAVVGTVMYTIYGTSLGSAVSALPPDVAALARDSIGAAVQIASSLPSEQGSALATEARSAFTEALGLSLLVGVGLLAIGILAVWRFMPAFGPEGAHGTHGHGTEHDDGVEFIPVATADSPIAGD